MRIYPSEYVNGPRLRMEVDFCAKKGFEAKKAQGPLARLHQLGALHSGRTGRARTTAGAVILARAAALRADPCAGAPAGEGCNPCQERAPFPGGKAPCRNDARCFNPEPEGRSKVSPNRYPLAPRSIVISTYAYGRHVLRGVRVAVLALVIRQ